MNRKHPACILALVLTVMMLPVHRTFGLEPIPPQKLLERVRQAQEPQSPITRRVERATVANYADHPEEQERSQMTIDVYLDTTKVARRNTFRRWWPVRDNARPPTEQFNQSIWDGERYYSVSKWYAQSGVALWSGGTATTGESWEAGLRSTHVGAELNGVLRSDYEPYYKILEDAKEIKVRIDQETFGVATYHIEATTKRGFYQIWIDPEQNYHIRRAIVERSAQDLGWNDVPISKYEWSPKKSMRYTLTNDKFDTIDGHIFPVKGRAVFEAVFLNGGPGGSRAVETVTDIRITSIELNPDFSALRAFTPDAPPMTLLTDWSNDNKRIVWTGSSVSDDEALIQEATRAYEAAEDAGAETLIANAEDSAAGKRTPIYDPGADAKQDIADAVARAAKDNKRVLIQWGANWCGWCYKLHDIFNQNKAISKILAYEYEVVMVDSDVNAALKKSYGATYGGVPFLTVLDAHGAVIKNQATGPLEIGSKHDPAKVEAFLTAWKAAPLDADDVLKKARVQAHEEAKRVFLLFGAPWCGWCHRLEGFLARPAINAIMQEHYVLTKIDTDRMTRGRELLEQVNAGSGGGVPWFAITDDAGGVLITSTGPKGNCGYPVEASEIAHFMTMLSKTAEKITPEQISLIESSLKAAAEKFL